MAEPIYMVVGSGQSLRYGEEGEPAITTRQEFKGLQSNGSIRAIDGALSPLLPVGRESIDFGMSDYVYSRSRSYLPNIVFADSSLPGQGYSAMKKGTAGYNYVLQTVRNVVRQAGNRPVVVLAATIINGETDHITAANQRPFVFDLLEWQSDLNGDIKRMTGQSTDIPFLLCQMSSFVFYGQYFGGNVLKTPTTSLGQLEAAKLYPERFRLVTPKYIFQYANDRTPHLSPYGYRHLAQYYGKVLLDAIEGKVWKPLHCTKAVFESPTKIVAYFHVPVGKLRWDTGYVAPQVNMGFEYRDSGSIQPAITSVSLGVDGTTVEITLNRPRSSGAVLRYAWTIPDNPADLPSLPGQYPRNACGAVYGPRGNLCDSDQRTGYNGQYLANFCCHFEQPIGG